jgi:hypothetical protein
MRALGRLRAAGAAAGAWSVARGAAPGRITARHYATARTPVTRRVADPFTPAAASRPR